MPITHFGESRSACTAWRRHFTTVPQFCIKAQRSIRLAVLSNARQAFDVRRHVGDVLSVILAYFAYWAIMPPIWLAAILAVAIPTLIWRDAHVHRAPAPEDAVTAGFLVGGTILASQVLLLSLMGLSSAASSGLFIGSGMCTLFVSGWRIIFSMKDRPPEPSLAPYRKARWVSLLWLVGAMSLLEADRQLLSSNSHLVDFLLAFVPPPVFRISLTLRAVTMGSLWSGPVIQTTLFTEVKKEAFLPKLNRVFRTAFDDFWAQFFLRVFFIWIALPMAVVLAGVALGRIPAQSVNWLLFVSTAAGFAVLCKTWIEVKTINENAAATLQKAFDSL